uniref:Uncharacterized protein n=1 Tax=Lepeophtheirus salmonis TaxID=72036 RepID=A0A0K2UIW8_LEPSM
MGKKNYLDQGRQPMAHVPLQARRVIFTGTPK